MTKVSYERISDIAKQTMMLGLTSVLDYDPVLDGVTDNTAKVVQALTDADGVHIPKGCAYDRSGLPDLNGKVVVDDSTGIRVTSEDFWWYPRDPEIVTIAHRGAGDLAPENTLAALSNAYLRGFDGVEVDVRMTSDDVPVLLHDATLDRTSSGTGSLANMTLAQIQTDANEVGAFFHERFRYCRIPRLFDALDYMNGRFKRIHLEIKGTPTNAQIDKMVDQVINREMERQVIFISSEMPHLTHVRSRSHLIGVGLIDAEESELFTLRQLGGRVYCSFQDAVLEAPGDIVAKAHDMGIAVYGKVSNSYDDAYEHMQYGINVVQSDNGVMVRERAPGGPYMRPCYNLLGTTNTTDSPGSSVTQVRDEVVSVGPSTNGNVDALNVPMQLRGGESVYVETYVRRIGDSNPGVYIGVPGKDMNLRTLGPQDDWIKVGGYINIPGSINGVDNTPLKFGFGSAATGTAEFMGIQIGLQSATCGVRGGAVEALVELLPGGPVIADNVFPRGVKGVFIDTSNSNTNVIAVRIEGAAFGTTPRSMFPQVQWFGLSAASNNYIAKYLSYSPAPGAHASDNCFRIGLFDMTGAPVAISGDQGFISITA